MTMSKGTTAYKRARKRGNRAEIDILDMKLSFTRGEQEAPTIDQVVKPKIYRTQTGRSVTVKSWMPAVDRPIDRVDLLQLFGFDGQARLPPVLAGLALEPVLR